MGEKQILEATGSRVSSASAARESLFYAPDPHGFDLPDAPVAVHRRSIIDDARLGYEAHWEQMLLAYPHLRMMPWDDQDAAVREAWIEAVTPEEPWFT